MPLAAVNAQEIEQRQQELLQLRSRIGALIEELNQVRDRFDSQRAKLRETEQQIGQIGRSIRQIDSELQQKMRQLKGLHQEQQQLRNGLEQQRQGLIAQLRAAHRDGQQPWLKLLLGAQSVTETGRLLVYYSYFNRARSERIAALGNSLERLQQSEQQSRDETAQLQALRVERMHQLQRLERSQSERQQLVTQLQQALRDSNRQLDQLRRDEQELDQVIATLTHAIAKVSPPIVTARPRDPFGDLRGQLDWPTEGPLAVAFGSPRAGGRLTWQGVLIRGQEGQPVHAIAAGRVVFADWLRGYGLMLIIDHDEGYMSLYGHNQSLFRESGDVVSRGEVIASLGNSGGRDEPVLYFEIRERGRPRDPVLWCRRE